MKFVCVTDLDGKNTWINLDQVCFIGCDSLDRTFITFAGDFNLTIEEDMQELMDFINSNPTETK